MVVASKIHSKYFRLIQHECTKPVTTPLAAHYQLSECTAMSNYGKRGGRKEQSTLCKCSRMSNVRNGSQALSVVLRYISRKGALVCS